MPATDKVPSVISYSPCDPREYSQWGHSLSPDAVIIRNTRRELDIQDTKSEELDLILKLLDDRNNLKFDAHGYSAYRWKQPKDIITDYLMKVYAVVKDFLEFPTNESLRAKIPVDLVITVPTVRSRGCQYYADG
jgi:hypothetical protein